MTTPGGAGTLCNALSHPPRARRTGFSHTVGAPIAPGLRPFALPTPIGPAATKTTKAGLSFGVPAHY
jgi:hypothetical protein